MAHKVKYWMGMVMVGLHFSNCRADSSSGVVKELVLQPGGHVGNGCPVFFSKLWPAGE